VHVAKHFVTAHPFRCSSLRGLGAYANVFAIEQMMDELAVAAGQDPATFRLAHLPDPRARAVIEAARDAIGWGKDAKTPGRGQGIAYARYKNTAAYCAVAVDAEVDEATGVIRVTRAVCAGDAGEAIAPDGIANQLEGGLIQSLSWTLKERVRFTPGEITSVDWETYPILTFREAPEVETLVLDRPGEKFLGVGEASQGPTAAAIANSVFAATGVRLRELPFTPERVRAMILEARRSA
jgi:CO/xanthine dehydrogenase Mo-binding subunit